MWTDVRLAFRQSKRRPAHALACIAVLAFGVGTCTAVFSALYSAVLKPLPYPEPDSIVVVHNRFPELHLQSMGASPADYLNLSQHHELFVEGGAFYFLDLNLSGIDVPKKVNAVAASSSLFHMLGAQPLLGRTFDGVEQRYRGPHAVILSEAYWQSAFAADPGILHRSLQLDGELYPIVGVMPKSFAFPNPVTQMWTPLALRDPTDSRSYYLRMYARLASGLKFSQASDRIVQLSGDIATQNPQDHPPGARTWSYFLTPLTRTDDGVRRWLWMLFAAVACFLLIVCSNVAGLVLARSSERRSDLAVRMALGASRWRIAQQVLTEVLLLAGIGGIAGLAIAQAGVLLLARYGPTTPPRLETPVFGFCVALSLLTGVICGLYPATYSVGTAAFFIAGGLTDAGYQRTAGRPGRRWQQGLIVVQVGIATTLLVCGGLLIHSLVRLLQTPLGFDAGGVLTMNISLPPLRYSQPERRARFFDTVLEQISALPKVDAASACTLLPFGYGENINTFEILGQPKPLTASYADLNTVSDRYFETMHIPLLRGRVFTRQDRPRTVPLTVIDETFARRFFANENPVGRRVKMPWGDPTFPAVYTVAGVVGSARVSGLDVESPPTLYFSASQSPVTDMTLTIRSSLRDSAIIRDVQRITAGIDRDQPIYDIAQLQARIDRSLQARRFVMWLMLVFAAAGTGLAAIGLYGLLSYTTALRRREIGIRMTLGASNGAIAMLVCRDGMVLVAAGMLLGAGAALSAYRAIASQMYRVNIEDSATWFMVVGIVSGSGLIASILPAWRVTRLNPAEAIRTE